MKQLPCHLQTIRQLHGSGLGVAEVSPPLFAILGAAELDDDDELSASTARQPKSDIRNPPVVV